MRAALAEDDPLDRRPARQARRAVPMVHAVKGGEVSGLSAGVAIIGDGAPSVPNRAPQDSTDCASQGANLLEAQ